MPEVKEFYFESTTGKNRIFAKKVVPDSAPKGIVQIAHGFAGHTDRFRDFMLFLAENGYVAVANDHLGHGRSISSPDEQGYFAEKDGWSYAVGDMEKLHDIVAAEYPELPYVLYGHSMGSFLTRTYLIQHPDKYDAAILSGTGHQSRVLISSALLLLELLVKLVGPKRPATALNNVAFIVYNRAFRPRRTNYDWLSEENAEVVWCYARADASGSEKDTNGKVIWHPAVPVRWFRNLPEWAK